MFTLSFAFFIILAFISLLFGLICKILVHSTKILIFFVGLYISGCIVLAILASSILLLIPVIPIFIGIFIGKLLS